MPVSAFLQTGNTFQDFWSDFNSIFGRPQINFHSPGLTWQQYALSFVLYTLCFICFYFTYSASATPPRSVPYRLPPSGIPLH